MISRSAVLYPSSGASSSQTPFVSNINGAGFALTNVGSIQVTGTVSAATLNVLTMNVTNLVFSTNTFAGTVVNMNGGLLQTTNAIANITLTGISNGGAGKEAGLIIIGNATTNFTLAIDEPIKPIGETNRSWTIASNSVVYVHVIQPNLSRTNVLVTEDHP